MEVQDLYQDFVQEYNRAIHTGDSEALERFVGLTVPPSLRESREYHWIIRSCCGNAYCRLGEPDKGEREYELGFWDCPEQDKWEFLINWSMAPFRKIFQPIPNTVKQEAIRRCLQLLEKSRDFFVSDEYTQKHLLTIRSCKSILLSLSRQSSTCSSGVEPITPRTNRHGCVARQANEHVLVPPAQSAIRGSGTGT